MTTDNLQLFKYNMNRAIEGLAINQKAILSQNYKILIYYVIC